MDDNAPQNEVIEAEVIEGTAVSDGESAAQTIISLTNLINANLGEIENLRQESMKHKEMLDSVLENDATYKEHAEKAREAARIKGNTKKEIFKRTDVKHVVEKLNEVKENIKETQEELSNYIQEYSQLSGQNYFEAADGTIQEIVYVAKLRKKAA